MKKIERKILLNPGPATTSDSVKNAQIIPDICPREEEFTEVMDEIRENLVKIVQGGEDYACILFGGSGTAAMDSVINSAVQGKLLIINNGYYGQRFIDIAKAYNIDYTELKFDMDKEIEINKIEEELQKNSEIKYIAVVHHETTTGILNPIKEIGQAAKKYGCIFIVDTVSSFAGAPFSVKECNIDFMMSTSNKCIHGVPGVCFVIAKKQELEKLKNKKKRSFYLDLYEQYEFFEKKETGQGTGGGQTRFTPPVQTMYSLRQAIREFFENGGIEERYKKYTENYNTLMEGLKELGFQPMHNEKIHSRISTTFLEPEFMNIDFKQLHDKLYEKGFIIYPNRVELREKTVEAIRFANMGEIDKEDIKLFLTNLKEVLEELKTQKPENKKKTNLTAVILAAGIGSRLKEIWDKPKCLFEINRKSLLEYSLDSLSKLGIKEAIIVIGYKGNLIKEKIGENYKDIKIKYAENKDYLTTDTIYSLYMTKQLINTDIITLEGDVLYDPVVIKKIIDSEHENLVVITNKFNKRESLVFSEDGEYIGISKLSKEFVDGLFDYFEKKDLPNNKKNHCENLFHEFSKEYNKPLIPLLIPDLTWGGLNNSEDLERLKKEIFPRLNLTDKKIKKILLINPSIKLLQDSLRRLTSPLGLLYLGTVLKKNGYEVKIVNSPCEGYENVRDVGGGYIVYGLSDDDIKEKIRKFDPDLVGVGNLFSAQRDNSFNHCKLVKEVKDVPVIIGGIHATLAPQDCIDNPFIDYVILGEGEHRILKLVNGLNEGKETFDFDGIAYKKDGKSIIKPVITRIDNLDEYGVPDRSLVDMKKYFEVGVFYSPFPKRRNVERIMTSRGCPFHCIFCAYTTGKKMIFRSVDNVIAEIDDLVKKYGIGEIQFSDDNLTVNKERAMELFKKMEPYGLSWCTPNGIMVKTLDKEIIEAMAKSGAYQITFNIESGSQRVLKEIIHKDVPEKEAVKELVKICHDNGIQVHGQLMIGLPGETKEEIEATLHYPYSVDFDSVSFFIANPLPGSQLFELCKKKGYLKKDRTIDLKSSEIVIPEDDPDFVMPGKEMERLVDESTREYNDYIKEKHPGKWKEKFSMFHQMKHEEGLDIKGRIT